MRRTGGTGGIKDENGWHGRPLPIIIILGTGVNAVNTGVVNGHKLDSQIFEGSRSAGWEIKIHQLLSLKCSRNFFSFNI